MTLLNLEFWLVNLILFLVLRAILSCESCLSSSSALMICIIGLPGLAMLLTMRTSACWMFLLGSCLLKSRKLNMKSLFGRACNFMNGSYVLCLVLVSPCLSGAVVLPLCSILTAVMSSLWPWLLSTPLILPCSLCPLVALNPVM